MDALCQELSELILFAKSAMSRALTTVTYPIQKP